MGRTALRPPAQEPDEPVPSGAGAKRRSSHLVVGLTEPEALDAAVVGGKAASLSRAARAGLDVLPGVVVPVGSDLRGLSSRSPLVLAVRAALGAGPLVVRSSSPVEDTEHHSMAGRFASVRAVVGDAALADAIEVVARSGARVAAEDGIAEVPPVAVLVQPMVEGPGGVCFGVEPVSGRVDRLLAVVSPAGPEAVVNGRDDGARYLMTPAGRLLRREGVERAAGLSRSRRRALAALVARVGELFDGPQDVEFLFEVDGSLRLLQARAVTTEVRGPPTGAVLGGGPVAETFPDPLGPLETSLWVDPLREGLREALRISVLASRRELRERPLLVVIGGRVAIDLELVAGERPKGWRRLRLRQRGRRAWATWRVGRLRGALPGLARDVVQHTDSLLADVGSLAELSDRQLVGTIDRCRVLLRALHGHEILMGLLVTENGARLTGASVAMRSLAAGRRDGLSDDEIIVRTPVVLALTGPRLDGVSLPRHVDGLEPALPPEALGDEAGVLREGLRLRIRWVQELTARAVRVLADRLAESGRLPEPGAVRVLGFAELADLVGGSAPALGPEQVSERLDRYRPGPLLPARFRLDADGRAVPVDTGSADGTGAGGGRGRGTVVHDPEEATGDDVLVVRHLTPDLAWVLPRLSGLVAETGSPLAHLAILAREASVATVVAAAGATERFTPGAVVTVDGATGAVDVVRGSEEVR
jgi:phosphohistidine swiveling domain-containing protein